VATERGRGPLPLQDPIAQAYIDWSIGEGHPANTISRRRSVLRSIGNPGTATREEIEAWWASRRTRSKSNRANDLAIYRAFIHWCQVWEHREDNPAVRIKAPKVQAGAPKPTSQHDLEQLLHHIGALRDGPKLRRAVLLCVGAGLRRAEAADLDWRNVDRGTRTARVTGKGGKTRIVKLSAKLLAELGEPHPGNVVTGSTHAWMPDTLGRKVNQALRDADCDGTMHKLRHRYGSVAYQQTKDPKALAEQMGHGSVDVTMRFYAAAADEAADAIATAAELGW